jgi:hypothetical protein
MGLQAVPPARIGGDGPGVAIEEGPGQGQGGGIPVQIRRCRKRLFEYQTVWRGSAGHKEYRHP